MLATVWCEGEAFGVSNLPSQSLSHFHRKGLDMRTLKRTSHDTFQEIFVHSPFKRKKETNKNILQIGLKNE